jgi:hypothetical protein
MRLSLGCSALNAHFSLGYPDIGKRTFWTWLRSSGLHAVNYEAIRGSKNGQFCTFTSLPRYERLSRLPGHFHPPNSGCFEENGFFHHPTPAYVSYGAICTLGDVRALAVSAARLVATLACTASFPTESRPDDFALPVEFDALRAVWMSARPTERGEPVPAHFTIQFMGIAKVHTTTPCFASWLRDQRVSKSTE